MSVSCSVARAALRQCRHSLRPRIAPTTSCAAFSPRRACYHAYSLPSTTTQPPRNDGVPETSINNADGPLPRVHETRPPAGQDTTLGKTASTTTPTTSTTTATSTQTTAPKPAAAAAAAAATETEAQAQKPKAARPRPKLRPRKAAMKLTPSAVDQLRSMLDQPEPKLIKVGVRNRGCSGLAYHLEYVDKAGPFDEAVEQDGVKVLVDSKALFSIIGSEMDWAEDKLSARFVFKNPNIKEECGCGESFMV